MKIVCNKLTPAFENFSQKSGPFKIGARRCWKKKTLGSQQVLAGESHQPPTSSASLLSPLPFLSSSSAAAALRDTFNTPRVGDPTVANTLFQLFHFFVPFYGRTEKYWRIVWKFKHTRAWCIPVPQQPLLTLESRWICKNHVTVDWFEISQSCYVLYKYFFHSLLIFILWQFDPDVFSLFSLSIRRYCCRVLFLSNFGNF